MYPSYLFTAGTARELLGYLLTATLISLPLLIATSLLAPYLRKRKQTNFASMLLRTTLCFQILLCVVAAFLPALQVSVARYNARVAFARYRTTYPEQRQPVFNGAFPRQISPPLAIEANTEPLSLPASVFIGATGIWLSGSLFLLIGLICSAAYVYRLQCRSTILPSDHRAYQILRSIQQASKTPLLKIAEEVRVPFAVGPPIAPPAIFLPADWDLEASPLHKIETAKAVLAHEATHLERQDPLWNATGRLLAALFWINPLQWLLLREMDRVQELICDEKAMQSFDRDRDLGEYAKCLLQFSAITTTPNYLRYSSTAIVKARPSFIEERIQNIMSSKRSSLATPISTRFRIGLLSGTALFVGSSVAIAAQTNPTAQLPTVSASSTPNSVSEQRQINLDIRDEKLDEVLKKIAAEANLKIVIEPDAAEKLQSLCTFATSGQTPSGAIRLALRAASDGRGLRHKIEGDTIRIYKIKVGANGLPTKNISLNYERSTPLVVILTELFKGSDISFPLTTDTDQSIRIRLTDVPFEQALNKILQTAPNPLKYSVDSMGDVNFQLINPPPHTITKELPAKNVSADFTNVPLRTAIEKLLLQARCDFSIANEVPLTETVTDQFQNMPLQEALPRILQKSSLPLEYYVSDGVVIVRSRRQR